MNLTCTDLSYAIGLVFHKLCKSVVPSVTVVLSGHPDKRAHFWIIDLIITLIRVIQTNRLTTNYFPSVIYANSYNELLLILRQRRYLFCCHRLL